MIRLFFCLLALASMVAYPPNASAAQEKQFQLETAFIYQFTNYIDWPTLSDPFVISVVGTGPLADALEVLAQTKTVKGRKLRIYRAQGASELKTSQIIVVTSSDDEVLQEVVSKAKDTQALIVSHAPGFAEKGAMINFFLQDGRLRFEINRSAIEHQRLQVSSQLLKLAKLIP